MPSNGSGQAKSINSVCPGHHIVQGKIEGCVKVIYVASGIAEQNSVDSVVAPYDDGCRSVNVSSVV